MTGGTLAVAFAVWALSAATAFAAVGDCSDRLDAPKPGESGRPILVLVETDPWAMVLGSDSPRFALYDDGFVIYRTRSGFRQFRLDRQRTLDLRLNASALACLGKRYSISDWTDQPSELLFFGRGGALSTISIYGRIGEAGAQPGLPAELVAAYQRLVSFGDPKSRPWLPDYLEVMVWPYEYAPQPSIVWPSKWPGLSDLRTVKRGDGYSIYLPSNDLEALRAFLRTEHEKGAVEIGGRKWAVSYRFPFPQETRWHFEVSDPE